MAVEPFNKSGLSIEERLEHYEEQIARLGGRFDNLQDTILKQPVPFGSKNTGGYIRVLIGIIVILQLLIGGWIAVRLGPEGYSRAQARANWATLCDALKQKIPDFVCPPIAREKD